MSLKDDLQEIRGIGKAKADSIMTVFEEYEQSGVPESVRQDLEEAMSYYEQGQYEYAGKFLRRVMEDLN